MSMSEHEANDNCIWVSDKAWNSFSDDEKKWVQAAADEVNRLEPGKAIELERQSMAKLEKMGVKFVKDVDKSGLPQSRRADPGQDRRSPRTARGGDAEASPRGEISGRRPARMRVPSRLVLETQRHLKWRALDVLEAVTMVLCGVCLAGFSTLGILRRADAHPRSAVALAAGGHQHVLRLRRCSSAQPRRRDATITSICRRSPRRPGGRRASWSRPSTAWWCSRSRCAWSISATSTSVQGFGSFRMPSMTPIASLYAAIPVSGLLIALFTVEQLVNGWRHGFESAEPPHEEVHIL